MTTTRVPGLRFVVLALATVALGTSAYAAGSADLLRCQKTIHTRVTTLVKLLQTSLTNCAYRVESCQLAYEIDGEDPTQCIGGVMASCAGSNTKILTSKAAAVQKALTACLPIPPADPACPTGTVADLVPCIFDQAQCAAERTVFALDPRAAAALDLVALAGSYPCVAP